MSGLFFLEQESLPEKEISLDIGERITYILTLLVVVAVLL